MSQRRAFLVIVAGIAVGGCTKRVIKECEDLSLCTERPDPRCQVNSATGHRWCSYLDDTCISGYRWGDDFVGDDLAGTCVEEVLVDAEPPIDGSPPCEARVAWLATFNDDLAYEQLWTSRLDGTDLVQLTTAELSISHYRWSPNGDQIVYSSPAATDPTGAPAVWVVNADGSDAHRVSDGQDLWPDWSPDGALITWARFAGTRYGIWIRDMSTGDETNLSDGSTFNEQRPVFLPDGARILYWRFSGTVTNWTMNLLGSNDQQVPYGSTSSNWAPDLSRIAYVLDDDIWGLDGNGFSNNENLTDTTDHVETDPQWLPDGSRILYRRDPGPDVSLWSMASDGSDPRVIPILMANDPNVDVSSTGMLTWHSTRAGTSGIYVSDFEGTNVNRIVSEADVPGAVTLHSAAFRPCPP